MAFTPEFPRRFKVLNKRAFAGVAYGEYMSFDSEEDLNHAIASGARLDYEEERKRVTAERLDAGKTV